MKHQWIAAIAVASACAYGSGAAAQVRHSPILDKGSVGAMRAEVDSRYDAAVALTKKPEIVHANDVRFTWASEAKVACGIAHGFLRKSQVDEDSINKCDEASQRMQAPPVAPVPVAVAEPAQPAAAPCTVKLPIVFYFEWNVAQPPADAAGVAQATVQQMQACGWRNLEVAGHADASGAAAFNQSLSEARARNVADLLRGAGVPAEAMTVRGYGKTRLAVQTADGVREPLNRRVEVNIAAAQQ
jgi:outer membrane protein OmpA-like peptidoglycan-associated protein